MRNNQLSEMFNQMSAMYKYLGGDDRFRAIAYKKAAAVIGNLEKDVETYFRNGSRPELPGIGESISAKIVEFIRTGKIQTFEKLKKTIPYELVEMMEIRGFGPASLHKIHDELRISKKDDLIKALQDGRVARLSGFGTKKIDGMLRGLKLHKIIEDRMLLWHALSVGEKIVERIKKIKGVLNVELAGSLRRRKETIGDFDILISSRDEDRKKIVNEFATSDLIDKVISKGNTKLSVLLKGNLKQIDIRIIRGNEWGSALQYFTGSKEHNIHLRTIAKEKGFKISEYGVYRLSDNKRIAGKTEEEVYGSLGFQYMPPEIREDTGEIELSAKHEIPKLIDLNEICGDLQMHSNWSDGSNTIEQIAEYILKHYSYKYIVITDHSKSSRIANGMDEKQILQQVKEIDQVNKKIGKDFVKKGIEVDILHDGTLDISDEILEQLDWVTASIHSGFNIDNTDRIVKACMNPNVACIGHLTGRLIGAREPYKLDIKTIFSQAKKTGTAIEINAQPNRMDISDSYARMAKDAGVKLVVSTDAHVLGDFDFMKLGVYIARRAFCTKQDVLNTQSWSEIERYKNSKRKLL